MAARHKQCALRTLTWKFVCEQTITVSVSSAEVLIQTLGL